MSVYKFPFAKLVWKLRSNCLFRAVFSVSGLRLRSATSSCFKARAAAPGLQSCASVNVEGNNSTQLDARLAKRQIKAVLAACVLKKSPPHPLEHNGIMEMEGTFETRESVVVPRLQMTSFF